MLGWLTLSLSPRASGAELLLLVCYGMFGFLVARTVRTRREASILVWVIVGSALVQAFYGTAELFSGSERILGAAKRFGAGSATGTFVNRNHFAGFLEMAFPLGLGLLLARAKFFSMERGLSLREKIVWFAQENVQWTAVRGLALAFIGIGLVFSRSRSGITVFLVTIVLAAAAVSGWRDSGSGASGGGGEGRGRGRLAGDGDRSDRRGGSGDGCEGLGDGRETAQRFRRLIRALALVIVGGAVWLGIGPVLERFARIDITREGRRTFAANTAEMIGDFPAAGTGRATYVHAYGMYEKIDDGRKLSYAHNDYLEAAAESGLPAAAALTGAAIWLVAAMWGAWRRRRSDFVRGVGLGAMLGVAALLIHGLTDFNLQVPANAIYFVTLAALGAAVLRPVRPETARISDRATASLGKPDLERAVLRPDRGVRRAWIAAKPVLLIILGIGLLAAATRDYLGRRFVGEYRGARRVVESIQRGFARLEGPLLKAERISPHPEISRELGRLYLEMAVAENGSERAEARDEMCGRAADAYARALSRNPVDAMTWYERGLAWRLTNYPLGTYAEAERRHYDRALALKPADTHINLNVLAFQLMRWNVLEAAERAGAAARLRRMTEADPRFPKRLEDLWRRNFGSLEGLTETLHQLAGYTGG